MYLRSHFRAVLEERGMQAETWQWYRTDVPLVYVGRIRISQVKFRYLDHDLSVCAIEHGRGQAVLFLGTIGGAQVVLDDTGISPSTQRRIMDCKDSRPFPGELPTAILVNVPVRS